ncbi:hypothetical protein ACQEVS_10200 [Streptomyces sp. CA-181903]|uniref:hypothetical protein n=1 Tax=Streptomyces sp. CA-181903 TaxID=3240055 RepID=UPI003D94B040
MGVGAHIEHETGKHYLVGVDEDGDLYVSANLVDESRAYLPGACSAQGLETLAAQVADMLRALHTAN